MPRSSKLLPGGALAAAEYYTARLGTTDAVTLARAGELHGVTRQAVSRALRDPSRFARSEPPGRKPRGAVQRSIRLGGVRTSLRLTPAEAEAFDAAAAGKGGLAEWLRGLLEANPLPDDVRMAEHLRAIGRAAAGMPEE